MIPLALTVSKRTGRSPVTMEGMKIVARASNIESTRSGEGVDLGSLNDLIGFHITLAQLAVYRDFSKALAELEITQKQFSVLEIIFSNPDVSQIDIAQALDTDRATMMALVEKLDQRGFIERRQSSDDKRRQKLTLTPLGLQNHAEASRLIKQHEKDVFSSLTAADTTALLKILRKIYQSKS